MSNATKQTFTGTALGTHSGTTGGSLKGSGVNYAGVSHQAATVAVEEVAAPVANFTVNQTPAEKAAAKAAEKAARKEAVAAAKAGTAAATETVETAAKAATGPRVNVDVSELKTKKGKPLSAKALEQKPHITLGAAAEKATETAGKTAEATAETAKKIGWVEKLGASIKDTYIHNQASLDKIEKAAKDAGKEVKLPKLGGIKVKNAAITAGVLAITAAIVASIGNKGPGEKSREAEASRGEASMGRA